MMLKSMFAVVGAALLLTACDEPAPQAAAPPPPPAMKASTSTVYFAMGSTALSTEAKSTIQQAAATAKSGGARVAATGYTDTVGSPEFNMQLSMRRANAVKDGLVQAGVPATAITTGARGETALKVQTGDQVAEAQNRRVEIVVDVAMAVAPKMSDADYCKLLADTYRREARSRTQTDGGVPQAIAACDTNPASGIPTLVQVLQDNKVNVPPRT